MTATIPPSAPRAAVIGAGLAGAACARTLSQRGAQVVVFDKGRGPGGRLSTRRAETSAGELRFDHGAQYLTARTPGFRAFLRQAEAAGAAARWRTRLLRQGSTGEALLGDDEPIWTGAGAMNMLVKHALTGLDVRFSMRAQAIRGAPGVWRIGFEDGREAGPFDMIAIAIPAPQAGALLASAGALGADLAREADAAAMAPCFAVMAVFDKGFDPGFDAMKPSKGPLSWAARAATRPGAACDHPGWVLHASPSWSRSQVDTDARLVGRRIVEAFSGLSGAPAPAWLKTHRWLYAFVETAAGTPSALSADQTLGTAGDWRLGPRAECAWTSGAALGEALKV